MKHVLAAILLLPVAAMAEHHPILANLQGKFINFCINCKSKTGISAVKGPDGKYIIRLKAVDDYKQMYSGQLIKNFKPGDSLKLKMAIKGKGLISMGFIISDVKKRYIHSLVRSQPVKPDQTVYETTIPIERQEGKRAVEQPAHALVTFMAVKGSEMDILTIDYEVIEGKKETYELPEI